MGKLVKQRLPVRSRTDGVQNVQRGSQRDVGRLEKSVWVDVRAYTTAWRARYVDARLVALVMSEFPVEPSQARPGPSFQTARAPRGSSAECLNCSSPFETCGPVCESFEPVWSTKTQMWRRVLGWTDDDAIWRVQLTLHRTEDHEGTMKGPDAPTEFERTAHEITHLPLVVRHLSIEHASNHLTSDSPFWKRPEPTTGEPMKIRSIFWQSSTRALDACER